MLMKFSIEQRHLTDAAGKPIAHTVGDVAFHVCEAQSAEEAVNAYVRDSGAEVIGEILKFPGFQAVATMRSAQGVYTLQVSPASGTRVGSSS